MDDLKDIQMGFSRTIFFLIQDCGTCFIPNFLSPIEGKHSHDHQTYVGGPSGRCEGHLGGVQQEILLDLFFAEPFLDVLHIVHQAIIHGFDGHGIVSISLGLKSWV